MLTFYSRVRVFQMAETAAVSSPGGNCLHHLQYVLHGTHDVGFHVVNKYMNGQNNLKG